MYHKPLTGLGAAKGKEKHSAAPPKPPTRKGNAKRTVHCGEGKPETLKPPKLPNREEMEETQRIAEREIMEAEEAEAAARKEVEEAEAAEARARKVRDAWVWGFGF